MARKLTLSEGRWFSLILGAWFTVIIIVPAFFHFGPKIERRVNPVVSALEITSIEPQGEGALVSGRWIKHRDCQFVDMIWSRIGRDGWQRQVYVDRRPSGRPTGRTLPQGRQEMPEPWFVRMPADKIREQSVVTMYYRCHPLWQTTADFYP